MKKQFKSIVVLLCCGLAAACSYFKPQAEVAKTEAGPSRCDLLATIEDAENADSQILVREGRGGYIYTYADGLGSVVSPKGDYKVSRGGVGDSKFALRMVGKTASGGGDVYVGMGFAFVDGEGATYDGSKYTGISFIAKKGSPEAISAVRFSLPDANTDPAGGVCTECHNNFGVTLKLTEQWTRYVIFFDEMKQATGWGAPRPQSIDPKALVGMQIQVTIPNNKVDVWVDDIRFIGACGEDYAVRPDAAPAPAPAPEAAPEAAPETAPAPEATDEQPAAATAPAAN